MASVIEKIYSTGSTQKKKMQKSFLDGLTDREAAEILEEVRYLKSQVEAQEAIIQQLRQEALHDAMTGLPNRRFFDKEIEKALKHYNRYKHPTALLIIDVDQFKSINDTLGHLAGDAMLKSIAKNIWNNIRETDFVARVGGDEFCVILHEASAQAASAKAEQLAKIIESTPCRYDGQQLHASVSIGVCNFDEASGRHDLFARADQNMYDNKIHSKPQVL